MRGDGLSGGDEAPWIGGMGEEVDVVLWGGSDGMDEVKIVLSPGEAIREGEVTALVSGSSGAKAPVETVWGERF